MALLVCLLQSLLGVFISRRIRRAYAESIRLSFSNKKKLQIWHLQIFTKIYSFYCKRTDLTSLTYYHNHLLPDSLQYLFQPTSKFTDSYNTRHASDYRSNLCRTNMKQFTVLHQGRKIWNSLLVTLSVCQILPLSSVLSNNTSSFISLNIKLAR